MKIQMVILTLTDGREIRFSGPAEVDEGEEARIAQIRFTRPVEAPEGCSWQIVREGDA